MYDSGARLRGCLAVIFSAGIVCSVGSTKPSPARFVEPRYHGNLALDPNHIASRDVGVYLDTLIPYYWAGHVFDTKLINSKGGA